ncbi:hypothetical protein [Asanoa iriomotensis]|uniref:Uncharacterized protein n=1 Tax=Asanoa iriomotensis TaxID=234613 RepID=A0ABQ4CCL6_9ACTN|nr:hypothetical protein [Asanoa iriomotensis]GIF60508.1 hypothetical protein Air01nite_66030 [Asanoa iriomotensis]
MPFDSYPAVPLLPCPPGGVDRRAIEAASAEWVHSTAFGALLREFGGKLGGGPLGEVLDEAERFSAEAWDFRRGAERSGATEVTFPSHVEVLVREAATALGLAGRTRPAATAYDHVLILGGGVRTSLARAHHLADLLRGGVETPAVTGLGSFRPLPSETRDASEFGLPECETEADAVEQALRRALGLSDGPLEHVGEKAGEPWRVRAYPAHRPTVSVLAAPPSRPGARANTGDTLVGWTDLVATAPAAGARLLLVTTDLFVPFQHTDAVRLLGLGYGCGVETVGLALAGPQSWLRAPTTSAILQEVRSAIVSMRKLHLALAG